MSTPSRRDRTRPAELLGLSAAIGGFVGVVTALAARDLTLGLIGFGVAFILSLVTLATLSLTMNASPEERVDLDEQDRGQGH
jgi:VIT1/CCC1 family predicted Fe2+/Mn2+ transporter